MNPKQFKILIGLLIVTVGVGIFLVNRDTSSWQDGGGEMGGNILPDFPLNEVTNITINDGTNTVQLAQKDEKWVVTNRGDYPASFEAVGDLLRQAWDTTILQPVRVGESQLGRLNLLQPSAGEKGGTLLTFETTGGSRTLLLGKQHVRETAGNPPMGGGGYPDGRYVMPDGEIANVALVKEPFSSVNTEAGTWLNRDFIKVQKLRRISVESTNSWTAVRESESGSWQLEDAAEDETLDTTKTGSFNYALSNPSFDDVVVDRTPEELGLDEPRTVELWTFDGFHYAFNLAKAETGDAYYVRLNVEADLPDERVAGEEESEEDKARLDTEWQSRREELMAKLEKEKRNEGWTYQVPAYTFNSLLKDRTELLKTEIPKPPVEPITPELPTFPEQ